MGDEVSAASMVQYFGTGMAQLRGRAVYVQFSNHKELKTDQTHSNAVSDIFLFNFDLPNTLLCFGIHPLLYIYQVIILIASFIVVSSITTVYSVC